VKEERNVLCIWTRQTTCVVQRRGRRTYSVLSSGNFWFISPSTGRASLASERIAANSTASSHPCAFVLKRILTVAAPRPRRLSAAQAMRTAWVRAEEDEGGEEDVRGGSEKDIAFAVARARYI
jgi:hypothetical protein